MPMRPLRVLAACLLVIGACVPTPVLREFHSDGCSLFPDGTPRERDLWCGCCVAHDRAYWRGGSAEDREDADRALRDCVRARTGDRALAQAMYDGVRVGGHPYFPTWYRWGCGWSYGRGYAPLSGDEQRRADEALARYDARGPDPVCRR